MLPLGRLLLVRGSRLVTMDSDACSPTTAGAPVSVRELSFSDTPDGVPQAIAY
jgi:hypothetical protein